MKFESLEDMIVATAAAVRPPERLSVSEAAEKYRFVNNPGSYVGPWMNSTTPYLTEFMDTLASPTHTGVVFVGPAQSAKTDAGINYLLYTAICDPADMMFIQTSQSVARDFSTRRIKRLFRHSPAVGACVTPGRNNQNTFDVKFLSGMLLTLSWPTINELSGKPIPRLWLTDYDRMSQDVDGEGSPFDLAAKRATTFGRYGMCVAESSPGFVIEDPRWIASSLHEAPPTQGVLALYNRGDRRRWYWPCPHCKTPFEPEFGLLRYPDTGDHLDAAEQAEMECLHCGGLIQHDFDETTGLPGKHQLNRAGKWVKDGQTWMPDGSIVGTAARSEIASFWLKGVCAAFADWKTLVFKYLKAREEYERTGSEEALKATVTTDQGCPYAPHGLGSSRLPEDLKATARDLGERVVPPGVRFLTAAIDVQKNMWVVQVHGHGEGGDIWVIDRFDIRKSNRLDDDGERKWVNPASYPEDWLLLTDAVLTKLYPLDDDSGRAMPIRVTACDSGGRDGVTFNAYEYWRHLRDVDGRGLHDRFRLVRGTGNKGAPRVQIVYPDSERRDRRASARGEVPVLFIHSDMVKDQVDAMLGRADGKGGKIHFPTWLDDSFFMELTAETRTSKGWVDPKKRRNEAWDLLYYTVGLCLVRPIQIEMLDWENPPGWAKPWDTNDLVVTMDTAKPTFVPKAKLNLAKLAQQLA